MYLQTNLENGQVTFCASLRSYRAIFQRMMLRMLEEAEQARAAGDLATEAERAVLAERYGELYAEAKAMADERRK